MNPLIGLGFDVVILAALAATILYARRLSEQFTKMQADKQAFEQLISALNLASSRAEAAIKSLKDAVLQSGDQLQDKVNKARALSDELEIMIQAGDNLADRLSGAAEKKPKAQMPALSSRADSVEDDDLTPQPRSRAERELLEALKAKQQP
ncbi:MAG TPA: DUF6468 domain-containing protein [Patescibacteria group bacterium]|nr:DUF6468 domain-containing protein [Patescibacteria group bacterium]